MSVPEVSVPRASLPRFDALDPEVLDDPYPHYARLREAGPLCRIPPASLGVTMHAQVAALLRDARLANDFPEDNPAFDVGADEAGESFRRLIPTRGVDDHSRLHKLMAATFSPRRSRGYADRIGAIVAEAVAPALDGESLDAVADLAFPVAATVVCELMGLPASAVEQIRPRAAALARAFTPFLPGPGRPAADDALVWLRGYIADVVEERRARPTGDLPSRMLAAQGLSLDEIVDNLAFLCFTGFETTMNMVGTGCVALARFPDEFARLRADRRLLPTAVEEFVRLDAPIQYTARVTRAEVEIGGRTVRPGRSVMLLLGSANHDESVFRDPQRLDVGRTPNPHVGFGGGVRGCLGAALARVEGAVIFGHLLDRVAKLEPAAAARREPNALFRSYASVPLEIAPV